jgi:hypothetical protein
MANGEGGAVRAGGDGVGVTAYVCRATAQVEVNVFAHASPRWRHPPAGMTAAEANQNLSELRGQGVVRDFRETFLQELSTRRLGGELDTHNASTEDPFEAQPPDLRAQSFGSTATLREAGGDLHANSPGMRRAEIHVSVTWHYSGSAPSSGGQQVTTTTPARRRTRHWAIRTTLGAGLNGSAVEVPIGFQIVNVTFRNRDTNQDSEYVLIGVGPAAGYTPGMFNLGVAGAPTVGSSIATSGDGFTNFETIMPVNHLDWQGRVAIVFSSSVSVLGPGYGWQYLRVPTLVEERIDVGGWQINRFAVGVDAGLFFGTFRWRQIPTASTSVTRTIQITRYSPFQYDVPREFFHVCWFATESHDLDAIELQRLRRFVVSIMEDFSANCGP